MFKCSFIIDRKRSNNVAQKRVSKRISLFVCSVCISYEDVPDYLSTCMYICPSKSSIFIFVSKATKIYLVFLCLFAYYLCVFLIFLYLDPSVHSLFFLVFCKKYMHIQSCQNLHVCKNLRECPAK